MQYAKLNFRLCDIMVNKKARVRMTPYLRLLPERCFYVRWSLLSVATYPKALQRYE